MMLSIYCSPHYWIIYFWYQQLRIVFTCCIKNYFTSFWYKTSSSIKICNMNTFTPCRDIRCHSRVSLLTVMGLSFLGPLHDNIMLLQCTVQTVHSLLLNNITVIVIIFWIYEEASFTLNTGTLDFPWFDV